VYRSFTAQLCLGIAKRPALPLSPDLTYPRYKKAKMEGSMPKNRFFLALIAALFLLMPTVAPAADALKTYEAEADYGDVRFAIEDGIVNAGLKIDYRGNIGDMLDRTGKDVGSTKKIYKAAEFFQFCSARLSRAAMEADPVNMGICPYIVFIYERADTPGKVTVGYKRPIGGSGEASQKALAAIEKVLNTIVKEAIEQ
jgi:hypothetical protein